MTLPVFRISGREIGPGHSPYIIAEMSGNHNGNISRAIALIDAAKAASADAVKLQTYTADTITLDCDRPEFKIKGGLWDGASLYELYAQAHTPWDWHPHLFEHARKIGITIFSSPFDPSAVTFLEGLDAPAYKVASFELVDLPLIERIARTGKPVLMSTGLADLGEIEEAVGAARAGGCAALGLFHCVSGYPTPAADANLRTMGHLAETFGVAAGLSDHTMGIGVSVAACALGASFIEKHFTLARADGGPDAAFSLEPHELADLVRECRAAFDALGQVTYDVKPSEQGNRIFRRSLYVVADVAAGDELTQANVRSVRPGLGLPPHFLPGILGRRAKSKIVRGTPLSWELIEG